MTIAQRRDAAVGIGTSQGWSAHVYRDDRAFDRLADEWRDLYERCPAATPFQSSAWLGEWWAAYGRPGRLRLFAVRRGGRLVAAAPLMLVRRYGWPVLTTLGAPLADFHDVLLAEDEPTDAANVPRGGEIGAGSGKAARLLGLAIRAEPGWQAVDLSEARPGAAASRLLRAWRGPSWRLPASGCLELPADDLDELLMRLPRRTAGKVRARLRRIESRNFEITVAGAGDAGRAVRSLLDLHERQWRGRKVNPEHLTDRFRGFLAGAVPAMVADGQAAIFEYRDGDRQVAGDLVMIGHGFVGAYLYGAEPELRRSVDVSLLLLRSDLDLARARGRAVLSMLRGQEPYKMKWRPRVVRNERLILGRSQLARGYAAALRGRAYASDLSRAAGRS